MHLNTFGFVILFFMMTNLIWFIWNIDSLIDVIIWWINKVQFKVCYAIICKKSSCCLIKNVFLIFSKTNFFRFPPAHFASGLYVCFGLYKWKDLRQINIAYMDDLIVYVDFFLQFVCKQSCNCRDRFGVYLNVKS